MYKHQKQALYFMSDKERDVDFARYDAKRSMWRKEASGIYTNMITNETSKEEPRQVLGGILAGKICFLCFVMGYGVAMCF